MVERFGLLGCLFLGELPADAVHYRMSVIKDSANSQEYGTQIRQEGFVFRKIAQTT